MHQPHELFEMTPECPQPLGPVAAGYMDSILKTLHDAVGDEYDQCARETLDLVRTMAFHIDELMKAREARENISGGDLPDNIRVPLHELRADTDYLLHRANQDVDVIPLLSESMRDKCSQIETAVYQLIAERNEADRRAGAAERNAAYYIDAYQKRRDWSDDAKEAAGYHRNVSFDEVWAAALSALKASKKTDEQTP